MWLDPKRFRPGTALRSYCDLSWAASGRLSGQNPTEPNLSVSRLLPNLLLNPRLPTVTWPPAWLRAQRCPRPFALESWRW
jgi:hypothetical protein